MHAHGIQVFGDLVLHQYDGRAGGVYPSKRFPKSPTCFARSATIPGGVDPDPVPDQSGNYSFGDPPAYVEGRYSPTDEPGYMHDGAIAAAQQIRRTFDFDGFRIDDAKGTNAAIVYDLTHAEHLSDTQVFYEYFDGNSGAISNYVNGYEKRRGSVLDFAFKFNTGNICNNNSRVWMGQLADIGWCDIDATTAITFCESADTDTSYGQNTIWNKALQYAFLLTFRGLPMVFWRDYAALANCYGLKPIIDNLLWIHRNLAQGDRIVRLDTHPQVFVMERAGYGGASGCVCFFNNDQFNEYTITVPTTLGAYAETHEYTGLGPYDNTWTDGDGNLTMTVPRNDNGMGYLVCARPFGGLEQVAQPATTTQTLFGAVDLAPMFDAVSNLELLLSPLWVAADTEFVCTLTVDKTRLLPGASVTINLYGPGGARIVLDTSNNPGDVFDITATARTRTTAWGWHTLSLSGAGLPTDGAAFELSVTYQGAIWEPAA